MAAIRLNPDDPVRFQAGANVNVGDVSRRRQLGAPETSSRSPVVNAPCDGLPTSQGLCLMVFGLLAIVSEVACCRVLMFAEVTVVFSTWD